MNMPIKTFWIFLENINRLLAERDLRSLSVNTVSQSADSETYEKYKKGLLAEIGNTTQVKEKLDRAGLNQLKQM